MSYFDKPAGPCRKKYILAILKAYLDSRSFFSRQGIVVIASTGNLSNLDNLEYQSAQDYYGKMVGKSDI